jgi:hypothetical protein
VADALDAVLTLPLDTAAAHGAHARVAAAHVPAPTVPRRRLRPRQHPAIRTP